MNAPTGRLSLDVVLNEIVDRCITFLDEKRAEIAAPTFTGDRIDCCDALLDAAREILVTHPDLKESLGVYLDNFDKEIKERIDKRNECVREFFEEVDAFFAQ